MAKKFNLKTTPAQVAVSLEEVIVWLEAMVKEADSEQRISALCTPRKDERIRNGHIISSFLSARTAIVKAQRSLLLAEKSGKWEGSADED